MTWTIAKKLSRVAAAGVASVVLSLATATTAHATPFSIDFGPTQSATDAADFLFNLQVANTIAGDATLSLTLGGDFDSNNEHADVSIDGFSLGRVADGNPNNDAFNFVPDDNPDPNSTVEPQFTGTATIANADIAQLLTDGVLSLLVDTSAAVDTGLTVIRGTLSFDTRAARVPEPATVTLLASALLLAGMARRRRGTLAA